VIQESHETFNKINIQKDEFEIDYVNYEYDTGHWNPSKGGTVTFKLVHQNKTLFSSYLTPSSIHIQLEKSMQSFSEKIKNSALSYFSF